MKIILQRFSAEMFQQNYWARSLQQIVNLKSKRQSYVGSSGGSDIDATTFAEQMSQSNKKISDNLQRMIGKIIKLKRQVPAYDQKLFTVGLELLKMKEPIGFKQACSKIGSSLRDDFSEIDSVQNESNGDIQQNNVSHFETYLCIGAKE